jgi:predicted alpha/beta-hydrolase family hydrolase
MPTPDLLIDNPTGTNTLVLAHGAGAPMDHPFLQTIATNLAARGLRVVRFEFPYMAKRRVTGKKGGPNGMGVLEDTWRAVVKQLGGGQGLWVGGKSMGGRVASRLADELGVRGLVCLGYPFHPPAKPERTRTAHLLELRTPTLIVQGERDPFGGPEEVASYGLSRACELVWVPDGDHGFKPRKRSGHTLEGNLDLTVAAIAAWLDAQSLDSA